MPAPLDGRGLNPLLQDPGLAFHPPFLYLGYVGFSVAFSFAVAALIEGRVDAAWARWVRPWTLAAWCALTIGIAMGSWWAYYTLGWGGWWFWDPVENASFMPWLVGTALLHSAIVVEKRDALKSWTILLAILTFSLSLVGTFLVRSGVLTSVHAFAIDPGARHLHPGCCCVVAIGGSLTLYACRAPALKARRPLRADLARGRAGAEQSAARERRPRRSSSARSIRCSSMRSAARSCRSARRSSIATFAPLMVPLLVAVGGRARCSPGSAAISWARCSGSGWHSLAVAVRWSRWLLVPQTGGPILRRLGLALAAWIGARALVEWAERIQAVPGRLGDSLRRAAICRARRTA